MRIRSHIVGVVLVGGWVVAGLPVIAGDWHSGTNLICSDCHTIHNSEDGLPMRFDGVAQPAEKLLRAEDPTHLCVSCHDGTYGDAPDVIAPVTYLADPAGGAFPENWIGQQNPNGHDLLSASPLTAPGSGDAMVLTCLTCHGPHGTAGYRNLELEPIGTGNDAPVTVIANQTVVADGSNPSSVYVYSNIRHKSGLGAWCNDCHTNFHGRTPNEEGAAEPWLRHPNARQISGSYGADFTHWSGTIDNRVPVETPNDELIPSIDDRVICVSCHKAHGSTHESGLIFADGASRLSTCQQCHNQ